MNEVKDKLNVSTKWFLLLGVLITFAACSNKKKVVIKDNAGRVLEEYYTLKDQPNQKTGIYTSYYESGKIKELSNYTAGKPEGKRTLYFESGKIMVVENYKNGNYEGGYKSFYESGGLESEGQFKDNARDGVWKVYYETPQNAIRQEVTFKDNIVNGPAKEYSPNGKLIAEGNKIEIGDGVDVYDGKVKVYDSLGTLEKVLTYDKGRQISKEAIN